MKNLCDPSIFRYGMYKFGLGIINTNQNIEWDLMKSITLLAATAAVAFFISPAFADWSILLTDAEMYSIIGGEVEIVRSELESCWPPS